MRKDHVGIVEIVLMFSLNLRSISESHESRLTRPPFSEKGKFGN